MQFKKAAMTQIAQSGIRHGGKTVVSNEKQNHCQSHSQQPTCQIGTYCIYRNYFLLFNLVCTGYLFLYYAICLRRS